MSQTDRVVEALADMIRTGRFGGGDRLPAEAELAEELGVSRGSFREAVRQLSFAGVLDVRQGDGTYVTSLEADLVLAPLHLAVSLAGSGTMLELYRVRRILEPEATALATERLSPGDLDELGRLVDAMSEADDATVFVAADAAFHDVITAAAGNAALRALLKTLRSEAARTMIGRARAERDATRRTIEEHHAILDALRARDATLARAAATMHLAAGEHWLASSIADRLDTPDDAESD